MPKEHKTPGALVAEVKMTRLSHQGALLLVEGRDDLRFWHRRRDVDCELVLGENKANVVAAMPRLDAQQFAGTLGVVDSDYDTFTGLSYGSGNLVATDAHDLECVLCRSTALDAVIAEFGDTEKVKRLEESSNATLRQNLLDRALVFGRVRLAAILHGDAAGLASISIPRFVDEPTWTVDERGLVRTVQDGSVADSETWSHRVAELPSANPWYIVRGHDLIEILRIGLRQVLGSTRAAVGRKEIARLLRQAAPLEELKATGLYTDIRKWEASNPPYAILPADPAEATT